MAMKNFYNKISLFITWLLFAIAASMIFISSAEAALGDQPMFRQTPQNPALMALTSAIQTATSGPATIELAGQGTLHLPENYLFVPRKETIDCMHAVGKDDRSITSDLLGMIIPKTDPSLVSWFMLIEFRKVGYLRDEVAVQGLNADNLMNDMQKGADEVNKRRIANGMPAIEIVGWDKAPTYDVNTHQVTWSVQLKNDQGPIAIQYRTLILGREGYFELILMQKDLFVAQDEIHALTVPGILQYKIGKRYEDFVKSIDRVSGVSISNIITEYTPKKNNLLSAGILILILITASIIRVWLPKGMNYVATKVVSQDEDLSSIQEKVRNMFQGVIMKAIMFVCIFIIIFAIWFWFKI